MVTMQLIGCMHFFEKQSVTLRLFLQSLLQCVGTITDFLERNKMAHLATKICSEVHRTASANTVLLTTISYAWVDLGGCNVAAFSGDRNTPVCSLLRMKGLAPKTLQRSSGLAYVQRLIVSVAA